MNGKVVKDVMKYEEVDGGKSVSNGAVKKVRKQGEELALLKVSGWVIVGHLLRRYKFGLAVTYGVVVTGVLVLVCVVG